jgi:hypothetical protein
MVESVASTCAEDLARSGSPMHEMGDRNELRTNRDLYSFVTGLRETADGERSLEDYLKTLWRLGSAHRHLDRLSLHSLAGLLEAAFHEETVPFDAAWMQIDRGERLEGYAGWERTILLQVVDLHEMERVGTLSDPHAFFGIDAPSGARWYNFDPLGFLECAVEGTVGGWEEGDPSGRMLVPGPVAYLDEAGEIRSADPRELRPPTSEIEGVSWDFFARLLWCGQSYE